MLKSRRNFIFMMVFFLFCQSAACADSEQEKDIAVKVQQSGEMVLVDVSFFVQATPQQTWEVLTDFDHMTQFVANFQFSKIIGRSGDKIQVEQKGKSSYGLFSFSFESVREIESKPYEEIRSHLISGSMKKLDATTQLIPDGTGTRVLYHSESVPGVWVPPVIGATFIKQSTREQFQAMRNEILKRNGIEKK